MSVLFWEGKKNLPRRRIEAGKNSRIEYHDFVTSDVQGVKRKRFSVCIVGLLAEAS